MVISAVNALTCNMDLIAWIDSRCVIMNVGFGSLREYFQKTSIETSKKLFFFSFRKHLARELISDFA